MSSKYTVYRYLFLGSFRFYTVYKFGLTISLLSAIYPTYQEYQVAASLPLGKAAYPFGILQFKLLKPSDYLPQWYNYVDFDTEALYLESAFAPLAGNHPLRLGARSKVHAFDWQNLNYFIEETSGKVQEELSVRASYLMGDVFLGGSYHNWVTRVGLGAETSYLVTQRQKPARASQCSWHYFYTLSGYYHHYPYLPGFPLGKSLLISYTAYNLLAGSYPLTLNQPAPSVKQIILNSKISFFIPMGLVKIEQRLAATLSGLEPTQDVVRQLSLGGPEISYGRLAGFAFSEYRSALFSLTNLDILLKVKDTWYLWLVHDTLFNHQPLAKLKLHGGSGIGVYHTWLEQKERLLAFFVRLDRAHSASRQHPLDRWQIFTGLLGFSF